MFASFLLGLLLGAVAGCAALLYGTLRVVSRRTASLRAAQAALNAANGSFLETAGAYSNDLFVLDWVRATLQLAGKESTRVKCWVSVQGTRLFVGEKRGDVDGEKAFSIDLSGTEMRKAPPQVQLVMPHCLELLHPHRKLVAPSADYIFLSFATPHILNEWVDTLSRWCVTPVSDEAFALPMYDPTADNLIRFKGPLLVQYGEGAPEVRYCVLERYAMTHFDTADLIKARSGSRIHLYGVPVHEVAKLRFKAVSPGRPLCTSGPDAAAVCDYAYFTVPKAEAFVAWRDAFAAHNVGVDELTGRSTEHEGGDAVVPLGAVPGEEAAPAHHAPALLLASRPRESAQWLNALLARFAMNWRVSTALTETVRAKMTKRLQQKIEARNLQSTISELQVVGLHLPASLPAIVFAQLLSSTESGKLVCDALLDWDTHADPCVMRVACDVAINWPTPRFKVFSLELTLAISRLYGKAHLECNAFPASRFSFSFVEEPQMEFACKSGLDALPLALSSRLEDFLVQKIKLSLLQKVVMPNRKYFSIPKSSPTLEPTDERHVLEPQGSFMRKPLGRTTSAAAAGGAKAWSTPQLVAERQHASSPLQHAAQDAPLSSSPVTK